MAEKVQVDVELTGADKAVSGLDDVADAAERVEDHDDVRVEADADVDDATRGLRDVDDARDKLDGTDATITARLTNETSGPLADIFGDLNKLEAQAKSTGEKLDDVGRGGGGGGPRANAIADLTGPLGDVSSQASDLAGVFDGMGDIMEGLAPKLGISADQMVGAIGGVGFAITAAATLWGYFSQKSAEAAEQQQKVIEQQRKLNELLDDQKFKAAGEKLVEDYGDAYDAAQQLGIPVESLTRFLSGQSDTLDELARAQENVTARQYDNNVQAAVAQSRYDVLSSSILGAKASIDGANDSIAVQDARAKRAGDALRGQAGDADETAAAQKRLEDATKRTSDAFDRLRGAVDLDQDMLRVQTSIQTAMDNAAQGVGLTADEVLDLKSDIIDLAQTAKANPAQVRSTLDKIDRGDLAGVKADAEGYYSRAPVQVTGKLNVNNLAGNIFGKPVSVTVGVGATSAAAPAAASVVNVTQHLPRGFRGDALTAARQAARRSGGLYQRFSR
jgi:predicted transcriptional regulator